MALLKNLTTLVSTTLLFTLTIVSPPTVESAGTPGFVCTVATEEADCLTATTFLKCDATALTCGCLATTTVWEAETSKCALLLNQACTAGAQPCRKWSECVDAKCQCVKNTVPISGQCKAIIDTPCNTAGAPDCDLTSFLGCNANVCKCVAGHEQIEAGKCKGNLADSCASPGVLCDPLGHLICDSVSKKCGCTTNHAELDGKCLVNFDEDCTHPGVICDWTNFLLCNPTDLKCKCKPDTIITSEGECKAMLSKPCNIAGQFPDCDPTPFLACGSDDNLCHCQPNTTEIEGVCLSVLGGPCKVPGSPEICDESSFLQCNEVDKLCHCQSGTTPVHDVCRGTIDSPCGVTGSPELCDELSFLHCGPEGVCLCRGDTTNVNGTCLAALSKPCDVPGSPVMCDDERTMVCDENDKICKCKTNLGDNGEGKCRVFFDGSCDELDRPCDENQFLDCLDDAKCGCKSGLVDIGNFTCRALIGATCHEHQLPCDESNFLECDPVDLKCICMAGYADNGEGECRRILGGPCDSDAQCDEANYAECSSITQTCICRNGFVDTGRGRCRVVLGGACAIDAHCDENNFSKCGLNSHKCVCMIGFHENSLGHCRVEFGGGCTDDKQCDQDNFLECGDLDVCQCMSGEEEPEDGQCQPISFRCQRPGLFGDPRSDTRFHNCQSIDGQLVDTVLTCPDRTVWSQQGSKCVLKFFGL